MFDEYYCSRDCLPPTKTVSLKKVILATRTVVVDSLKLFVQIVYLFYYYLSRTTYGGVGEGGERRIRTACLFALSSICLIAVDHHPIPMELL